jgi:hypothetical protein
MLPTPISSGVAVDFLSPDDRGMYSYPRDLERGALALNDPAGGLEQADWEGWFDGLTVYVRVMPDGEPEAVQESVAPCSHRLHLDQYRQDVDAQPAEQPALPQRLQLRACLAPRGAQRVDQRHAGAVDDQRPTVQLAAL